MTCGEKNQSEMKPCRKATSSAELKDSNDIETFTSLNPASSRAAFSSFPNWGCPPLPLSSPSKTPHASLMSGSSGSRNDEATMTSRLAMMPPGLRTRFTSASAARVSGTCMSTAWQCAASKVLSSKGNS